MKLVGSGNSSIRHDNWTGQGNLLHLIGPLGPQVSGIDIMASVSSVVTDNGWPVYKSRHPILRLLCSSLPAQVPDIHSNNEDFFLWRNSIHEDPSEFSVAKVWSVFNPSPPPVDWHSLI